MSHIETTCQVGPVAAYVTACGVSQPPTKCRLMSGGHARGRGTAKHKPPSQIPPPFPQQLSDSILDLRPRTHGLTATIIARFHVAAAIDADAPFCRVYISIRSLKRQYRHPPSPFSANATRLALGWRDFWCCLHPSHAAFRARRSQRHSPYISCIIGPSDASTSKEEL